MKEDRKEYIIDGFIDIKYLNKKKKLFYVGKSREVVIFVRGVVGLEVNIGRVVGKLVTFCFFI